MLMVDQANASPGTGSEPWWLATDVVAEQEAVLDAEWQARLAALEAEASTRLFDGACPTDVWDSCPPVGDDLGSGREAAAESSRTPSAPMGPLASLPVGVPLSALIESSDPATLSDDALVDLLVACDRQKAALEARQLAAVAVLTTRCAQLRGVGSAADQATVQTVAAAEVAPALRISTMAAEGMVALADSLRRLPGTRAGLASGALTLAKVRAIVEACAQLDDEAAAAVEVRVLARASDQTPTALRRSLRRAVISADPGAARRREDAARRERGVFRRAIEDGLGLLTFVGPMAQVEAAYQWINALARQAQDGDRAAADAAGASARSAGASDWATRASRSGSEDESTGPGDDGFGIDGAGVPLVRTLAQCRADVMGDLGTLWLTGAMCRCQSEDRSGSPKPRGAELQVVVAASTLLGEDDEPAELIGLGPLSAQAARAIAADATWRRLLVEPGTRRLLDLSTQTHDPPAGMRRFVIARDRTCRSPGCRQPAHRADLDHTQPWPDGPTSPANLSALCRRHHRLKTLTDTELHNDGQGAMTWTMPSGATYRVPPEPVLEHPDLDPVSVDVPPF